MRHTSTLVLPSDPGYTGHREAEKRHRETLDWLRHRERELDHATDALVLVPGDSHDPAL